MFKIDWQKLSDEEVVDIGKKAAAVINERIEKRKSQLETWAAQFNDPEEMVLSYIGDNNLTLNDIAEGVWNFLVGNNKEKTDQIHQIVESLIKKSKVVKDGDRYSST